MFTDILQHPVAVVTALAAVIFVAYVTAELAGRVAQSLLVTIVRREGATAFLPNVRRPIRIVRAAVFLAMVAALSLPALDVVGVRTATGMNSRALTAWFFGSGLRIVIIAILTYMLVRVIAATARRLEEEMGQQAAPDMVERLKRARTLSRLVQSALTVTVVAIAVLMMLRELRMDIMPILTGAGIVGLAVGFGAQTLVKDLIAGFFLTLENQVRVGDVATINGTGGLVEAINLRTIVLRDVEGVVHVFPNGSIERLANRTKDFSYYVVDVAIAYNEDPDEVVQVLRTIGTELGADPTYRSSILEPLEIMGIDGVVDSQVIIKIRIKTLPLKQWEVGRELRRRIKKTFDAKGIAIPLRHVALYFGETSKPFVVQQSGAAGPVNPSAQRSV
jgi:small-conductance mechanosensitive channel